MEKLDLKKQYKSLYSGKAQVIQEIEIPPLNYLMIDGAGDPNNSVEFQEKVSHLYGLAYTVKFMIAKSEKQKDYVVAPLEGLWWCDDMKQFSVDKKDSWFWTLMVLQPDFISNAVFEEGMTRYAQKKKLAELPAIRLAMLSEGKAVQSLHIGPYSTEGPLIASIHQYIKAKGCVLHGRHHEIYLNNPRKTAPEKMKTLIRQPFL